MYCSFDIHYSLFVIRYSNWTNREIFFIAYHPDRTYIKRNIITIERFDMKKHLQYTAIIEHEGDGYVSLCPELDIASQGDTVEEAKKNLQEAVELFFECASEQEIKDRLHEDIFITRLEVAVG